MSILDNVTSGVLKRPRRIVLYGVHGIGKSTAASKFRDPFFFDFEGGCNDLDVARTPVLSDLSAFNQYLRAVIEETPHETLVVDTVDWLEAAVKRSIPDDFDTSWGKGTQEENRRMRVVLSLLDKAIDAGKTVVLLGHAKQSSVVRPDGTTWTQYTPSLSKGSISIVSEWCDELLFANSVVTTQRKEINGKQLSVGRLGDRVLHTEPDASYDAKHRHPSLKPLYSLDRFDEFLNDLYN